MAGFDSNIYRKEVLKNLLSRPGTDFDPFEVFAVDPSQNDQVAIEARIAEVVAFWRREQSSARYKTLVGQLLERRDALAAELTDPVRRAERRERSVAAAAAADAERFERLDALVARLAATYPNGVPQSRLHRLRTTAQRSGVSDSEFDERTAHLSVVDDGAAPLAAPVRKQMRELLSEYRRLSGSAAPVRSLYDFLGLDAGAESSALVARRDDIGARNRQRRHDRLKTVTDELLVLVEAVLVAGDRAAYQSSLVADVKDLLRPEIEAALVLEDRVNAHEFEHLVRRGVAEGLDAATARTTVTAISAELGGAVETGAAVDYLTCAACGGLEPAGTRRSCRRCGASLYRSCPGCNREVEAAAHVCVHCGADLAALARAQAERAAVLAGLGELPVHEREAALITLIETDPTDTRAASMLSEIAVGPPRRVSAFVGPQSVKVAWRASSSPGQITYRVERIDAGVEQPVGATQSTDLEDAGAVAGTRVAYRVTAERRGSVSAPAQSSEVLVAREVKGLACVDGDHEVRLTWDPPAGGAVWMERTVVDSNEPTVRTRADPSGTFTDIDVTNGCTYEYRVWVEYPLEQGAPFRTEGRTATGRPFARPQPLRGLNVTADGDLLRLTWPPPAVGTVQVVRSPDRPEDGPGTVVNGRHLQRYGTVLGPDATDLLDGSARWYLPVTLNGDEGILGDPVGHPGLPAIADVTVSDADGGLLVRWSWPKGCTEAQVRWTGPDGAHQAKVTNMKYELGDGFTIPSSGSGAYEVTVVPGSRSSSGEIVWADPTSTLERRMV